MEKRDLAAPPEQRMPISLVSRLPVNGEPGQRLPPLLRSMRPLQWSKNLVVFAALLFTRQVFDPQAFLQSLGAFVAFCSASSAIYLVNDIRDIGQDQVHPVKRFRPIAAGQVSVRRALALAAVLLLVAGSIALAIRPELALLIGVYVVTMFAYTMGLKQIVILDVFVIAGGFVLRAAGGAVAIDVPISAWLYICTLLLALFLGFGKRRHELLTLESRAGLHRRNLETYSVPLLDQLIAVTAGAALLAYAVYTFVSPTLPDNHAMVLTIPLVAYALFRYLYLVYRRDEGGSPEVLLARDRPLTLAVLLWGAASMAILYLS